MKPTQIANYYDMPGCVTVVANPSLYPLPEKTGCVHWIKFVRHRQWIMETCSI